jgi:aerobic C4-dicarboxylate transport protein
MKKSFYKILYVQVLFGIFCGIIVGLIQPEFAIDLKPLGDAFIKLIKMIIAPVIFCTVVSGIGSMHDMKKVGRVGGKALIYFEVISTLALIIGLIVSWVIRPGDGFNVDVSSLNTGALAQYTTNAHMPTLVEFLLHIIPTTFIGAFAEGNILQVLLIAILVGFSLSILGEKGRPILQLIDQLSAVIFTVIGIVMKVAPIGAFGAMAFTIGEYGITSLLPLAKLIGAFYLTCFLFIFIVLGIVTKLTGFSIWRFIMYIKAELLVVLGTSSSECALPSLMEKLQKLGCSKSVVGLVVPTGYSFNLDGTNIYMTMAALFIAHATNTELTLWQELTILGVAMLTSKGASGVTGAGFVTLAATLAVVPTVPVAGMVLILGIDRFMSECRALTNFVGNGVAAIVVSKWENELDMTTLKRELSVN